MAKLDSDPLCELLLDLCAGQLALRQAATAVAENPATIDVAIHTARARLSSHLEAWTSPGETRVEALQRMFRGTLDL
jgi:hypothetical protein